MFSSVGLKTRGIIKLSRIELKLKLGCSSVGSFNHILKRWFLVGSTSTTKGVTKLSQALTQRLD